MQKSCDGGWFTAAWQADTWNENCCTFSQAREGADLDPSPALCSTSIRAGTVWPLGLCRSHMAWGVNTSCIWADPLFNYLPQPDILRASFSVRKRGECGEFTDWFCRRVRIFLAPISQNSLQMFNQFVLAEERGAERKVHTPQTVRGCTIIFIKPQLMCDFLNNYDIGKQSPFEIFWSASLLISLWICGPEVSFWLICSNISENSSKEMIEEFRVVVFSSASLENIQSLIYRPNWLIPLSRIKLSKIITTIYHFCGLELDTKTEQKPILWTKVDN